MVCITWWQEIAATRCRCCRAFLSLEPARVRQEIIELSRGSQNGFVRWRWRMDWIDGCKIPKPMSRMVEERFENMLSSDASPILGVSQIETHLISGAFILQKASHLSCSRCNRCSSFSCAPASRPNPPATSSSSSACAAKRPPSASCCRDRPAHDNKQAKGKIASIKTELEVDTQTDTKGEIGGIAAFSPASGD